MQAIKVVLTGMFVLATTGLGQAAEHGSRAREKARPPAQTERQGAMRPAVARDVTATGSISAAPHDAGPAVSGNPLSRPFSKGPPSFR